MVITSARLDFFANFLFSQSNSETDKFKKKFTFLSGGQNYADLYESIEKTGGKGPFIHRLGEVRILSSSERNNSKIWKDFPNFNFLPFKIFVKWGLRLHSTSVSNIRHSLNIYLLPVGISIHYRLFFRDSRISGDDFVRFLKGLEANNQLEVKRGSFTRSFSLLTLFNEIQGLIWCDLLRNPQPVTRMPDVYCLTAIYDCDPIFDSRMVADKRLLYGITHRDEAWDRVTQRALERDIIIPGIYNKHFIYCGDKGIALSTPSLEDYERPNALRTCHRRNILNFYWLCLICRDLFRNRESLLPTRLSYLEEICYMFEAKFSWWWEGISRKIGLSGFMV